MNQTAVEWLSKQISSSKYFYNLMEDINSRSTVAQSNIFDQAKEMEKEQIEELKAEIKALKQVKDLNIPAAIESVCLCTTPIGSTAPDKCGRCGKNIGWQTALCLIKQGPPPPPLDRKIWK